MNKKDKFFRTHQIDSIENLIDRFLDFEGMTKNINLYGVVIFFNSLPDDIKMGAKAWSLKNKKLFVETESSSISNILSFKKHEIIQLINNKFNKELINDIIFSITK